VPRHGYVRCLLLCIPRSVAGQAPRVTRSGRGSAAQYFVALTLLLALDALKDEAAEDVIPAVIAEGVDAFLRGYR
jgi:hypothetical protein